MNDKAMKAIALSFTFSHEVILKLSKNKLIRQEVIVEIFIA